MKATSMDVRKLDDALNFGARISGVTRDMTNDPAIRAELNAIFEDRGMIVFENVEPTSAMHVALSNVFGSLKDHPNPAVARVDNDAMPGVIDMVCKPYDPGVITIDGKPLAQWLPWHFDHCYNNELNRAGVLRALDIPPEGGKTGFVDGIDLYQSISPDLRQRIEGLNILYRMNVIMGDMRFGRPAHYEVSDEKPAAQAVMEAAKSSARAVHPAVWTRPSGEKVLHLSPWMAEGIEGHEDAEGNALLEAVCQEINAKAQSYFHVWQPTDMLIWDNWRMLHGVSGMDPKYGRRMQRTTIRGDYGLGYFEGNGTGGKVLEMTF
jgi:taurine dioxygenase